MGWSQYVSARLAAAGVLLGSCLADDRERWLLWLPVFLGLGIAVYFALPSEPHPWTGAAAVAATGIVALTALRRPVLFAAAVLAVFAALGFASAQWRTMRVAAPVIQKKMGPVSVAGTVEKATLRGKGGIRLVLAAPEVQGLPIASTPAKIRITVRTKGDALLPGDRVRLRAVLLPPPEPVAPGAYDFSRQAWFDRVGAVGYAVSGVRRIPALKARTLLEEVPFFIRRGQARIAERFRSALPGDRGAVAAALMAGDRGGIPERVTRNLRDAGLAHLLAISGLHVGLVAGILFFTVRGVLALWESVTLRYPIKKWAALAALCGAFSYLLLTGATVSTQRAFIMTAIFLFAVMVDRAAITMRPVAWAAMIILLLTPESLWHAGFQMSFAAVIALIATYEAVRGRLVNIQRRKFARRVALYLGGILLTSLVAGMATAPFAAFHFNRFVDYGLVANMIAVPVTGLWIMPWGMAAYGLMPFGLESLALVPMGWGIDIVLSVARWVSGWPGAVTLLPAFPMSALVLIALGGLWACLWTRRWRVLGAVPLAAGLVIAALVQPPDVLVDRDGKMVAVRDAAGGLSISGRGGTFVAERWLRRDGQPAALPWPRDGISSDGWLRCDSVGCLYAPRKVGASGADHRSSELVALVTKEHALSEDCRTATIVISMTPVRRRCPSARVVIDRFDLWRKGAHALWLTPDGPVVLSAREFRGDRPWTRKRGTKRVPRPLRPAPRVSSRL